MKTFKELLIDLDACAEAREWAADRTIEQVVADCERGDWLAWLGEKIELDKRSLVLVGGHVANTVRHLMTDDRSKQAVDVCIAYGGGRATDEELNAAERAAGAAAGAVAGAAAGEAGAVAEAVAWAAERAARGAGAAAGAAARAAAGAAARAAAGAVARAAAGAVAWAAAGAAGAAAWAANQKQTADICRQYIGEAIIEQTNKLLTQ